MTDPVLILASSSPRRRELLSWAGVAFEVSPGEVDESRKVNETPVEYVRRLALEKAIEAAERHPGRYVLAADTVVVLDKTIMGKPQNKDDARNMLSRLSGCQHRVITAYCLIGPDGGKRTGHVETDVEFRRLSKEDIDRYIDSGEVWDKAGAYAIQAQGAALVKNVSGSFTNVIGLPLADVLETLSRNGLY
jgi:septum formation protein